MIVAEEARNSPAPPSQAVEDVPMNVLFPEIPADFAFQEANAPYPLPLPGEAISFLIKSLSHVDHANDPALSKKLNRLKNDLIPEKEAVQLVFEQIQEFLDGAGKHETKRFRYVFASIWRAYLKVFTMISQESYLRLRGSSRDPAAYLMRVIVEAIDPPLRRYDLTARKIWSDPEAAVRQIWRGFARGRSDGELARHFAAMPKIGAEEKSWEEKLRRWRAPGGFETIPTRVLLFIQKQERDLGTALLYMKAYAPLWRLLREKAAQSPAPDFGPERMALAMPPEDLELLAEAGLLSDVERPKEMGDAARVKAALEQAWRTPDDVSRLTIFITCARHLVQLGEFERALPYYEAACGWVAFRDGPKAKALLTELLPIAAHLNQKRIVKRWESWCAAVGIETQLSRPDANIRALFPNPYPEGKGKPTGWEGFVIWDEWLKRPPDLRRGHVNRMVKGFGSKPTPQLSLFAGLKQPEKVRKLLEAGADATIRDEQGGSAILCAVQGGCAECVALILEHTPPELLDASTKGGETPLAAAMLSTSLPRPDLVALLIEAGADVNGRNVNGGTYLHDAVLACSWRLEDLQNPWSNPQDALRAYRSMAPFMRPTASPFAEDQIEAMRRMSAGRTDEPWALHLAEAMIEVFSKPGEEIARLLLKAGADPDAQAGPNGFTPFLYAAERGVEWLLYEMLEHGADIRKRLVDGSTVLDLLNGYGHCDIGVRLLQRLPSEKRLFLRAPPPFQR